jgi:hypothetical protein
VNFPFSQRARSPRRHAQPRNPQTLARSKAGNRHKQCTGSLRRAGHCGEMCMSLKWCKLREERGWPSSYPMIRISLILARSWLKNRDSNESLFLPTGKVYMVQRQWHHGTWLLGAVCPPGENLAHFGRWCNFHGFGQSHLQI